MEDYNAISDRSAYIKLKLPTHYKHILQVYMPTSEYPEEDIVEVYKRIRQIIKSIPNRDFIIVTGDFNCKVRDLNTTIPENIRKITTGIANERRIKLAEFCLQNGLIITNTLFEKRRKWAWHTTNTKTFNKKNIIITRKAHRKRIKDLDALNTPRISDHKTIRCKIETFITWGRTAKSPTI